MKDIKIKAKINYYNGEEKIIDKNIMNYNYRFLNFSLVESIGYESINYDNGDIVLECRNKKTLEKYVLKSGIPLLIEDFHDKSNLLIDYEMIDDGVPCNKDTLYLKIECFDHNEGKNIYYLDYEEGSSLDLLNKYHLIIKELKGEEVIIEIFNKQNRKKEEFKVQLYNYQVMKDLIYYTTGAPNDPVDYYGTEIFMYLYRRDK